MTSKAIRPPFFELSASEEDYLKDIHFHLDFWEAEAKSALTQLKMNSDWKSVDAELFVGRYVLLAQKEDVEEEKVKHRAYGMYMALEYISKVRDCIENKQFIRAIRHSLKISYFFSRGDLFKAEIPKIYGAKGVLIWSTRAPPRRCQPRGAGRGQTCRSAAEP
jgi:hypothetical protein